MKIIDVYDVADTDSGWAVTERGEVILDGFSSEAAAWDWVDDHGC